MSELFILENGAISPAKDYQNAAYKAWKAKPAKTKDKIINVRGKKIKFRKFKASRFTDDKVTKEYNNKLVLLIPHPTGDMLPVSENEALLNEFNEDYQAALAEEEVPAAAAATHSGHGHMLSGWHTAPCTTIGDEAAVWGVGPTGGKRRKTRKHKTRKHKTRKHKTRKHKTRKTRRHKTRKTRRHKTRKTRRQ